MNTKKTLIRQIILNGGTIVVVALMLLAQRAWAGPAAQGATPGVMSYQGYLTDQDGTPINGNTGMTFRLYAQSSGGTALWDEAHTGTNAVPVTNGLFNVLLGSLNPIKPTVWDSPDLYLEVQVGSETMTPREQVGRVPYAMAASHALTADSATQLDAPDGNPAAAVYVDNSGRVGIGTTGPKEELHVNGDYYGRGHMWLYAFQGDGKNGTAYIQARDDSQVSNIDLQFRTQNAGEIRNVMKLTSDGNVDVNGDINVDGLRIDGHKPIFFRRLRYTGTHLYSNWYSTYSASQWSCGVVGFTVNGDIDESGYQDPLLKVLPWVNNENKWVFSFSQSSNTSAWFEALIMCVDNSLVEWKGDWVF